MSIRLAVEGMSCGNCVRHVTEALQEVPGVEAVEVSLAGHSATVEGTPDVAALIAALEEEGYPARLA